MKVVKVPRGNQIQRKSWQKRAELQIKLDGMKIEKCHFSGGPYCACCCAHCYSEGRRGEDLMHIYIIYISIDLDMFTDLH